MAAYEGRDLSRRTRLAEWRARLGDHPAATLSDDDVFLALEAIAEAPARLYSGRDADGRPIHRAKATRRAPATVNRYHEALAAVYSWGIKRRRLPKGTDNPCRKIARQPERNGVVRFLSEEERSRLLEACRRATWPKLYALVLMAITTGARRGELEQLAWSDVDLERAIAYVRRTKNDEPKVLPLVPAVVAELARLQGARTAGLVFASRISRGKPFVFDAAWQSALAEAGVKHFRFHDLRHTCASYLAQQGATLLEIADVMGHRQLAMVKRYAHLTVNTKAALVQRILGGIR
jgi:integrase